MTDIWAYCGEPTSPRCRDKIKPEQGRSPSAIARMANLLHLTVNRKLPTTRLPYVCKWAVRGHSLAIRRRKVTQSAWRVTGHGSVRDDPNGTRDGVIMRASAGLEEIRMAGHIATFSGFQTDRSLKA